MAYKGRYTPKNPHKYRGDPTDVIYRSLWERNAFRWCDTSSDVEQWSSETVVVPYICKTDGKGHRYFVDLWIKFANGKTLLVEIKPKKQVQPPVKKSRISKQYLAEVLTYTRNTSKWVHADRYAKDRGWDFQIWDEDHLKQLGIITL